MKLLNLLIVLLFLFAPIGWLYWLVLSPERAIAFFMWSCLWVYLTGLCLICLFFGYCILVILKNCLS